MNWDKQGKFSSANSKSDFLINIKNGSLFIPLFFRWHPARFFGDARLALYRQAQSPAGVGFFFNTMYNAVDTYFGGLVSTDALAALTLIAQNNGAVKFERCREVYRTVMRYGFLVGIVGMAVAYFFATPFIALFTHDPEVVRIGVHYLHISIWIYWAYMILYVVVSTLQGLKKPNFALLIGTYRQIIAPLIFFYLFARVLNWQLDGVWWGIFAINWTAVIISLLYAKKVMDRLFGVKN